MSLRLTTLVIDANDPHRLARFWSQALRWDITEDGDELGLRPTDGSIFDILFEPVTDKKVIKNRIHLDLTTTSPEMRKETMERVLALGARHVDIGQDPNEDHVFADPEGNEFCIVDPGNFVDDGGFVGSITCDGSGPTVGYFWAAALDWPLVWDQDDETAIRKPDGTGQFITWGPPLGPKVGKNRVHMDFAPPADGDQDAEVERLIALGARRIDIGQGNVSWVVMADPDDNEFCILTPR